MSRNPSNELLIEIDMTAIEADHLIGITKAAADQFADGGDTTFFTSAAGTLLNLIEERVTRIRRLAVGDERVERRAAA